VAVTSRCGTQSSTWLKPTGLAPEQVETAAKQGQLDSILPGAFERLEHAVICEDPLALEDLPSVFVDARSRLDAPLRLVLIDYLGLVGAQGKSDYERVSALGRGLKQLAKAEMVALIVAMQLSRAGGDGSAGDKTPRSRGSNPSKTA
jgi:hypothetical protein